MPFSDPRLAQLAVNRQELLSCCPSPLHTRKPVPFACIISTIAEYAELVSCPNIQTFTDSALETKCLFTDGLIHCCHTSSHVDLTCSETSVTHMVMTPLATSQQLRSTAPECDCPDLAGLVLAGRCPRHSGSLFSRPRGFVDIR